MVMPTNPCPEPINTDHCNGHKLW